jgi:hypothetical protein
VDFNKLTKQQSDYIAQNRTTELPPAMFNQAFKKKIDAGRKTIINKLEFTGFTLETTFPQNICLMKDGHIAFCHEFTEVEGEERPFIVGLAFKQVIII